MTKCTKCGEKIVYGRNQRENLKIFKGHKHITDSTKKDIKGIKAIIKKLEDL